MEVQTCGEIEADTRVFFRAALVATAIEGSTLTSQVGLCCGPCMPWCGPCGGALIRLRLLSGVALSVLENGQ